MSPVSSLTHVVKATIQVALVLLACAFSASAQDRRHPALALDGVDVRAALASERPHQPASALPITGIGTPHHLLAADLIARAFLSTTGNQYDRILILSPDHFFKSPRPAAVTRAGFETAFGPVETDRPAAERLLAVPELFAESALFDGEHGVTGLLPFVRLVHPDVPVVAVAVGIGTRREEWDRLAEALKGIVTPRTLIVQSTDYSHYLLPHVARAHDQQTLNALSVRDTDALSALHQPNHLDSRAANYLQLRLQAEVFGAAPAVIGNRTAFDYMPVAEPTTSYIVTAYSPDSAALGRLVYPDQQVSYVGGDVFIGRHFTELLANGSIRARLIEDVRRITGGAPLIVNLEGAMLAEVPNGTPVNRHAMPAGLAMPILSALGVKAASLANNHSHDLGKLGLAETERHLKAGGISALRHLEPVDMGAFRLVAVNMIGVGDHKGYPAARPPRNGRSDIEALCKARVRPPLVAFLHWGEEYSETFGAAEQAMARDLARCGVVAVIGAHSHRAVARPVLGAGGEQVIVLSLGNLIFDQYGTTSSGALAEVRVFQRGTVAVRLVPLPHLYDLARSLRER